LINRIVILSIVFIACALAINWVMDESELIQPDRKRNDPDLYMLNASFNQFDEQGNLHHTLNAARFTHFPLTDLTTMKQPSLELESQWPTRPWKITADEGRILPESKYREEIVELWDNVLAAKSRGDGKFIHIQTNSLTVYPERAYAETDQKVYIDNESGRTTAAGMKAFLDTGRFIFYSTNKDRVTTIFLPN
jgi:lipopolysaccharide export system protein LptC